MRNVFPAEYEEKYIFSIVMAVYNTAPFLRETIESILAQDIGFKKNVQLIMVDDGSKDGSGDIADEYALRFPKNIVVIHKGNGGVSSARNEGLKYVSGRYVNFLDSDDKLSKNTLTRVADFFRKHKHEVDLVAIPIQCFDGANHEHGLNYKFEKGTRIIDLDKEYDMIQINIVASFITKELAMKIHYDQRLKYSEDVKICVNLLLENRRFGVVDGVRYWRRIRTCGEASAMQKTLQSKEWYYPVLRYFHLEIFEYAKKKYGEIPRFVQYAVLFDLKFKLKLSINEIKNVLSQEEIEDVYKIILCILRDIDDDVILKMRGIWGEDHLFILSQKYNREPVLEIVDNDVRTVMNNQDIVSVSSCKTCVEFVSFKDGQLVLEGYVSFVGIKERDIKIYIQINNEEFVECDNITGRNIDTEYWGKQVLRCETFRGIIKNIDAYNELKCKIYTYQNDTMVERRNLRVGHFFPVGKMFKQSYAYINKWLVCICGNEICFHKHKMKDTCSEENEFIEELKEKKNEDVINLRRMYNVLKKIKQREIWLVGDRTFRADDNGEALFKYLESNDVREDIYFVLQRESPDYERVSKYGKVIEYLSEEHKLIRLLADKIILSDLEQEMINPFGKEYECFRDILYKQKLVFLQHGITKDDISNWVNRYKQNISLFITCVPMEYESILKGNYFYTSNNIKLTGFPRYDYLNSRSENKIIIMPTWRKYLEGNTVSNTDTMRHYDNDFIKSSFFRFYNSLINNERLLRTARINGYEVWFVPHPNLIHAVKYFSHNSEIVFCKFGTRYRDVIAKGDMLVTDYSSIAFDFAYLKKPVVYSQFDKEEFYKEHTYTKGYFNYEKDGFGEVEYTLDETINRVVEYMEAGCKLKNLYRERIEKFFKYHDKNNCRRVYEAIKEL